MAILIRQRHFSILYLVAITSLLIRMKSFICPRIFRKSIVGRSHLFYMSSHTGSCERTEVSIRPTDWKIDHTTPVHLVGSCFTDTITTSLKRNKFNCFSNGQGIMFNPISISECLSNVIKTHTNLLKAKTLFITFGTARVHILKETNKIVSNCHKQPADLFEKKLLTVNDIVDSLRETFKLCLEFNSELKIVLTVSPVRHTREGIAENSLSKSTLICAVHILLQEFPSLLYYFPSYEILIDELRDYRWYGDDLIHPSVIAQNIIFQRFSTCFVSQKAATAMKRLTALQNDMNHRPSEALKESKAYISHVERTIKKIEELQEEYDGYLNFHDEKEIMRNRLKLKD